MKNIVLIFMLMPMLVYVSSCALYGEAEKRTLSIQIAESIEIGESMSDVVKKIGYASEAIQVDKNVYWTFKVSDKYVQDIHQMRIGFSGEPKRVSSVSCIVNENSSWSKINFIKKYYSKTEFMRFNEPWCEGRHYGPHRALFVNQEKGIRIDYNRSRKDVGMITWVERQVRKPARVEDFYSCDKPKIVELTKLDPRTTVL